MSNVIPFPFPLPVPAPAIRGPLESAPTFGQTNWGNEAVVLPNGDEVIVCDLKAKCTVGQVIAVVFGVTDECEKEEWCARVEHPNAPLSLLRATLHWGLGCAAFDATMDLRHGAVVYLPAETLYVGAYLVEVPPLVFDPDPSLGSPPCLSPLTVKAGFAYGCVREAALLTEPVRALPGKRVFIPLPAFAGGFSLVPVEGQTLRVRVRTGGGPSPVYEATGPQDSGNFFPIPNGTQCLEIDNTSGIDPVGGFVVFRLTL